MAQISDSEYEEYLLLKSYHARQLALESIASLSLEDDMDAPIKKCVMAFALLGCYPLWSCCGFDYVGQPIHKWHEYGRVFFILENRSESVLITQRFLGTSRSAGWALVDYGTLLDFHCDFTNAVPQWDSANCIHYYEPASFSIQFLESFLMALSPCFLEEVVLHDTNGRTKDYVATWQYPPRGDWIIRKSDLLAL